MKKNHPVLHFLFAFFALGFLTGCDTTSGIATQDPQDGGESVKTVMVSTLAGREYGFADGVGSDAKFARLSGITIDAADNLYVVDTSNKRIRKITPAGEVSTLAGSEEVLADGIERDASFYRPFSIAIDATGNLFVADTLNNRIRKITPTGEVSTLAGGEKGFADGIGSDAKFDSPYGIAIDAAGNLYVMDNNRIRKITPTGEVSTLAGGEKGFADGIGSDAKFDWPSGIAIDAARNLYVADFGNHRIRKITPAGEVSTLAGGSRRGFSDGIGGDASFHYPSHIASDAAGNLYVTDRDGRLSNRFNENRIRKITPSGEVSTLAGGREGYADGVGSDAKFDWPNGIAIDAAGNLYVTDSTRIRKIEIRRP
ncbi:MAG: hypothetical protein LBE22_06015 [Azoarcus sp.]|jgi:DNA-binding beta-propeller fold protein YncE|nr:hypothetical protein [Azoarcus sp.]